jgi:S-adenosylmethionine:tRNA ribosyltransferase-isomerase
MRVDLFDFELPEERIALRPASPRDSARLLDVKADGQLFDRRVRDLPDLLRPGDLLVFNETQVIPAQFSAVREARAGAATSAHIDVTLHKRVADDAWLALVKGAKKLESKDRIVLGGSLSARVEEKHDAGEVLLRFELSGPALDEAIRTAGTTPLPPYIASRRTPDARDQRDYQTVYAREEGSVAAPTAGLHFTQELIARLSDQGVASTKVTLHVGAGTFLPVKAEDTRDHVMHSEWGRVSAAAANAINETRSRGGRVVPVGTTSLRLIETAAGNGRVAAWSGETSIFITPGYRFRAADLLMTNFHLPRSTLFMLVCAFSGIETMKRAYSHAIANAYRFYSYGDASLLERQS